jgi:ring-1,2-phenylacetyl-CoA epoxidase subunit PaaC
MGRRGKALKIANATEAHKNASYHSALSELLFQLADDDFILAFRGSEWLGLAPHIEEDVAFSSISQDMMGHAAMFYQLLENLGEGNMDVLAHERKSAERRNAVLLEKVNGPGHYLVEPRYDWAFAVVRHYFYTQSKKIRVEALKNSSYQPLSEVAVKVNMELYFHLLHWKTWFQQLMNAGGEARTRMETAIGLVLEDFEGLLTLGPKSQEMVKFALIDHEEAMKQRWTQVMQPIFDFVHYDVPPFFGMKSGNGRKGEHTADLAVALTTLSEVYDIDRSAIW